MDPQRFVQHPVERSAMVAKLLPQHLLGLGAGEVGRWRVAVPRSCFGRAAVPSEAGTTPCDDEASAPSAEHPGATPQSSLTTSAPVGGSGAGAGRFTHWSLLGGGTSSSGISTTAA
jgi:hypothetical protein